MVNVMNKTGDQLTDRIIYLMQTDASVDAPQDAISWSKNLFRTRAAAPQASFVKRIIARLQMDLSGLTPAFGERSGSPSNVRQMLFDADDDAIDLRIEGTRVYGQFLGEGFSKGEIELVSNSRRFVSKLNQMSEFDLGETEKGIYTLRVAKGNREIVIEDLVIE